MRKSNKRPSINLSSRATVVKHKAVVSKAKTPTANNNHQIQVNPRRGKASFFFGAEFSIPRTPHNEKDLQSRDLAIECCKTAVQSDIDDTYWWVVYKNVSKRGGKDALSLRAQHPLHSYVSKVGIIIIRKSDVEGMTHGEVAKMLDREVYEYGQWLNRPLV